MLVLWLGWLAWAEEPCPSPDAALGKAENEVVSYFLGDAETSLARALEGFGCSEPSTADQLARLWLAQGMLWHFGEDPRAFAAFAAYRRTGSDYWNPDYGDAAQEMATTAAGPAGTGTLELRQHDGVETVWIDGQPAQPPYALDAGYHLLQVGGDTARFARLFELTAGQTLTLAVETTGGGGPELVVSGGGGGGVDPTCRWPDGLGEVVVEGKTLLIGGEPWRIGSTPALVELATELQKCRYGQAMAALSRARTAKAMALAAQAATSPSACPWSDEPEVSVVLDHVTVDGVEYPVAGMEEHFAFADLLLACGDADAIHPLNLWRQHRRKLNGWAAAEPFGWLNVIAFSSSAPAYGASLKRRIED